ncbi:MAG TPA: ATP phosphoribosyltransferase regulatory subunit [Rhizomicrobium sp.]|jgi:ATP phosphoribosyltransferase regulatory subunit|nr:ATP phosphoribosyltransferase regulatory subunit [Rhizomicrobium sp.]
MVAFPYYDKADIETLDAQASAILGAFRARGYVSEEPSVLQPADIFLDRSGEEIRRRTFTLTDPSGRDLCLRPDLTIPICHQVVKAKTPLPARICYNGLVFRHQPSEPHRPTQFFQAGAELLGLSDRAAGETEIMTLTVEGLRAAGLKDFSVKIGDLALFGALVDALDVPAQWRARLKRHFWRAGYFEALLARMTQGAASDAQRLLGSLGGLTESESRAAIEGLMDLVADAPQGARTREEIVERLMEQAADAAALRLDPKIADVITRLLAVSGSADQALKEIRGLMQSAGITLDAPLAAMQARLAALKSLGVAADKITFAARFGRNMEYYTGFVFELWARDKEGPVQLAGGGRYDTLLEMLGAEKPVSAVGIAIRTERVLAARRQQGGA